MGLFCASGADVVDWLYSRVEGFKDRRDARKYASSLLKHGYLRHTVNKITFSEQCYYTFGDLCQSETPPPPDTHLSRRLRIASVRLLLNATSALTLSLLCFTVSRVSSKQTWPRLT